MPRFARQLLVASLVALHATLMVCGPCLHGLPGWGHGPGLSQAAYGDPVKSTHVQTDDCPVCHFLSQAQLPIDLTSVPAVQHVCVLKPETSSNSVAPARLHPTSPRAPPAPSARLS
jgi:hypothetical protein